MRGSIAALILALAAGPALGDAVPVRSGEHGAFTRLVLAFESYPAGWQLARGARGYELTTGGSHRFDSAAVFERIGRDRIGGLRQPGPGRLFIDLDCDCTARGFRFGPSWVVVDIEGPADSAWPRPTAAADAAVPDPVLPITLRPELRGEAGLDGSLAPRPAPPARPPVPVLEPVTDSARVDAARQMVLEQMQRALSQGLVDPAPEAPLDPADPDAGALPPDPDREVDNVAAETAVDRDRAKPLPDTPAPAPCTAEAELDLAGWGGTGEAAADIATARRAVMGEFDRPDPVAVRTLARVYIHYGFGAEARAVLAEFAEDDPEAPLLDALAAIMDAGRAPAGNPLQGQLACPGPAALWAVLARPELAPLAPVNAPEIRRHFSALPLAIRRHLGPVLAERLLDAGHDGLAASVRAAIERAGGAETSGLAVMQARFDRERGDADSAAARLDTVVAADDALSPRALIDLVELLVAQDRAVPARLVETAAAYAFERRGTGEGAELKRVELLALAQNGAHNAALDELARVTAGPGDAPAAMAALPEILSRMISDAHPADLARGVFAHRDLLTAEIVPPAQRRDLARRLMQAGLAETALALLKDSPDPPDPEDRLLRAEIHLALDNPEAALSALNRLAGARTEAVRSRALARLGRHDTALAAAEQAADAADLSAFAWRAGRWDQVAEIGTAEQREAVSLVLDAAPAPAGPGLATSRALLDESAETRRALRALLDSVPEDEAPAPPE